MKWLFGLLSLIFLIVFHELGHFFAAKISGVKVETFSVGFGKVLFHKTIKGTDFRVSLLPLGGYCGMKGEKDFQNAIENNLDTIKAEKDSLYGVNPLKRAFIGFAGPFANYIIALLSFTIIAAIGYDYFTYSNKIILASELYENSCTAAQDAGIITGDKIIFIDNKPISDFSDLISEVSIKPDQDLKITVDRNGQIIDFTVHSILDKSSGIGKIGLAADTTSLIKKETERKNIIQALNTGIKDSFEYIGLTFKSIGIMFKGVNIKNSVSGPARVTELLGTSIQEGFKDSTRNGLVSVLSIIGLVSLSLFIMNLLPIPILDGGLILLAFFETITRKKIKPKIQYKIQYIGLAFILFLFIIGCIGDISYFIDKVRK